MAEQFYIAQGTRAPALECLCEDNDGRFPLVGVTLPRFSLWGPSGEVIVDEEAAVVVDPVLGRIRYSWAAGDTDIQGYHKGRFFVTIAGRTIAFPSHGFIQVNIS